MPATGFLRAAGWSDPRHWADPAEILPPAVSPDEPHRFPEWVVAFSPPWIRRGGAERRGGSTRRFHNLDRKPIRIRSGLWKRAKSPRRSRGCPPLQKGVRGDFRPARPQLIQETDSRLASLRLPATGLRHSIVKALPQRFTVMDADADAIKDYIAQYAG